MTMTEMMIKSALAIIIGLTVMTFVFSVIQDHFRVTRHVDILTNIELTRMEVRAILSQRRLGKPLFIPQDLRNQLLGTDGTVMTETWIPQEVRVFRNEGAPTATVRTVRTLVRDMYSPDLNVNTSGSPNRIITLQANATSFDLPVQNASRWNEPTGQVVSINTPEGSFLAHFRSRSGHLLRFDSASPVNMGYFSRRIPIHFIRAGTFVSPVRVVSLERAPNNQGLRFELHDGRSVARSFDTDGELVEFSVHQTSADGTLPSYLTRSVMKLIVRLNFIGESAGLRDRQLAFEL